MLPKPVDSACRFIPLRGKTFNERSINPWSTSLEPDLYYLPPYQRILRHTFEAPHKSRCLKFNNSADPLHPLTTKNRQSLDKVQSRFESVMTLDLPNYEGNFYWTDLSCSKSNLIAVKILEGVFVFNKRAATVTMLNGKIDSKACSSLQWLPNNTGLLALGTRNGRVLVHDSIADKTLSNRFVNFASTICIMSVAENLLAAGCEDSSVKLYDLRTRLKPIVDIQGHDQQVCGLNWSPDGSRLLSGSDDNHFCVWDPRNPSTPLFKDKHLSAVKALDWHPERAMFLTGGGTRDTCISLWDAQTFSQIDSKHTGSQVSSAYFSAFNTIVSSHGELSNQIQVRHCPSLQKISESTPAKGKITNMVKGPEKNMFVTASASEILQFWPVFQDELEVKEKLASSVFDGAMLR
jgi:WD40 repeat protein